MKREVKRITIKVIVFLAIVIVSSLLFNSYEPTLNTKLAINQLNGGDSGFSELTLYNQIKNNLVYGYIVLFILMFSTNVVRLAKESS